MVHVILWPCISTPMYNQLNHMMQALPSWPGTTKSPDDLFTFYMKLMTITWATNKTACFDKVYLICLKIHAETAQFWHVILITNIKMLIF